VDVNISNAKGGTPLHVAACNDQVESIEALLSHGASMSKVDENGATALASAVFAGEDNEKVVKIIKLLVEKGSCWHSHV
jgi:ankyrin repeat protein